MKSVPSIFNAPYKVLVLLVVVFAILFLAPFLKNEASSLERYANGILKECAGVTYRPTCYEEKVPKLMKKISMEDAFTVTTLLQQKDPSYAYCHVLGHKLSAAETAKDPSKWESVIPRCPSGVCSNGCIHGAFQERFRKESFEEAEIEQYKPVFGRICEAKENWNPTGMEQASCYHALGHLIMYVTRADIKQALTLCREVAIKDGGRRNMSQLCFDGAFMQIFQPLEPDDFALIEGKEVAKADAANFCRRFEGLEQSSCRSESWPLFRTELSDPGKVVSFCGYLKDKGQASRCLNSLVYVITAQSNFDPEKMKNFCNGMPTGNKGACFANAASRMLENDYHAISKAAQFCNDVASNDLDGACYQELLRYSTFNFHKGSAEFIQLCGLLPTAWKDRCLNQN